MVREELTKTASWLYHNDYNNPVRLEIYSFLESYGIHPLTEITGTPSDSILEEVRKYRIISSKKKPNKRKR